jgi:hypothetical protein
MAEDWRLSARSQKAGICESPAPLPGREVGRPLFWQDSTGQGTDGGRGPPQSCPLVPLGRLSGDTRGQVSPRLDARKSRVQARPVHLFRGPAPSRSARPRGSRWRGGRGNPVSPSLGRTMCSGRFIMAGHAGTMRAAVRAVPAPDTGVASRAGPGRSRDHASPARSRHRPRDALERVGPPTSPYSTEWEPLGTCDWSDHGQGVPSGGRRAVVAA